MGNVQRRLNSDGFFGAKILNTNSRVQLLIIIMSRKTRNTKVEAAEESPEDIVLDSEEEEEDIKEEIKGEIFVPTRTQTQCVVIAPGYHPLLKSSVCN